MARISKQSTRLPVRPGAAFTFAVGMALFSLVVLGCDRGQDGGTRAPEGRGPDPVPIADISDLEHAFEKAAAVVGPSVVAITTVQRADVPPVARMFGASGERRGLGSGFIVSDDGFILTNNHVVAEATEISVEASDGRIYPAKLIGADPSTDVAVIKIEADPEVPFPAASLGSSEGVRVGQWVLAIGSPFGLSQTVTAGIISAKGRVSVGILDFEDFLQTDAPINMGNSGGPLVDLHGQVIGINTAIASGTGASSGIGFTVPIDMARNVMDQLISTGKVVRGWLGISFISLRPELGDQMGYDGAGVFVSGVMEGGPADTAGLKPGDVIIALDGVPIEDGMRFRKEVSELLPDTEIELTILRPPTGADGEFKEGRRPKRRKIKLVIAARPEGLRG